MTQLILDLFKARGYMEKPPSITQTCLCNVEDPLTPNFYIVKLGFTGVYIFSYFCFKTLIVSTC